MRSGCAYATIGAIMPRPRRAIIVLCAAIVTVLVLAFLVWLTYPFDLALRILKRGWNLSIHAAPFQLTILGVVSLIIAAGIKWKREGLDAMTAHVRKTVWETLIPSAAAVFLCFFLYNVFYTVPHEILSAPIPHITIRYGGASDPKNLVLALPVEDVPEFAYIRTGKKATKAQVTLADVAEFASGATLAVIPGGEKTTGTAFWIHEKGYAVTCSDAVYVGNVKEHQLEVALSMPVYASAHMELAGSRFTVGALNQAQNGDGIVILDVRLNTGTFRFKGPSLKPVKRINVQNTVKGFSESVVGDSWIIPLRSTLPEIGEKVFLYGVEQSEFPSYSAKVGSISRLGTGIRGIRAYSSDLPFRKTYCGAPILDQDKNAVGIVIGSTPEGEIEIALARYILEVMRDIHLR